MNEKIQEIFDKITKEIDDKTIQCARLDGYIAGLKRGLAEFDVLRNMEDVPKNKKIK